MKILIPIASNYGLDSAVYGHFGSAPGFLLVDQSGTIFEAIDNQTAQHRHGHCSPLSHLTDREVDAIVVGGIGRRALFALRQAGIQVYSSNNGTVQDALEALTSGQLKPVDELDSCAGHGHPGGCH
jgi:predicted Fe-Mo cluster-binding NifX family protein